MNYLISGGTGFIGTALIRALSVDANNIKVLTRSRRPDEALGRSLIRYVPWDGRTQGEWCRDISSADVVINLTGKNLAGTRWTGDVKRELRSSRIDPVAALVQAMREADTKPSLFISVSAAGYYGDTDGGEADETAPAGSDFLARLTQEWEAASLQASLLGVRTAIPRLAIVLEKSGGALPKMAMPFTFFVGGYVGSGRQWVSWIHMEDLVRALMFPIRHEALSGPYNCASPRPVTMKELCQAIGRARGRACWTRLPSFVLRAVLGEASGTVLDSLRVMPSRLRREGFQFHYENVDDALQNIYR